MPLVVPGVTVNNLGDSKTQEWMMKLMGKTLTDGPSSETASSFSPTAAFSKNDLPKNARIIPHGATATNDHAPDRLNVSLNEDGTVANVHHG
ncbi:hypothetical protein SEPCBS119000_002142 [Sporothrix epigloea]|uniref:Uncharacterized protein n=1 Tax=Sporothrix epigloea TaxID=1892477 RepID=A0ABP0DEI7_9PEZI